MNRRRDIKTRNLISKKSPSQTHVRPRTQLSSKVAQRAKTPPSETPFLVGIGASAGGLEAIRAFLDNFEPTSEVGFVIAQHMAPNYRSMLEELLSRDARIRVQEITDNLSPRPYTVYVTPPNHDVVLRNGKLRLVDADERIAPKPSIDRFFTSLAEGQGEKCGGIILSGTGSDGAQGVRAIKAAGGFVIVQSPESAKYDGMPRAAINTGVADLVLTPQEMAEHVGPIVSQLGLPEVTGPLAYPEEPFRAILDLLKRQTKVDFSQYKPNTLMRRLQRRIKACRLAGIEQYLDILRSDPNEVQSLFQDVLISVTEFFRDEEQYAALRNTLKRYIQDHPGESPLRIWSAGCASGEEPYSLAIIVHELMQELNRNLDVQIFSTDINDEAMALARRAVYSAATIENLPPELTDRYFDRLDGHFQVKKHLRESVVIARHDLTRDPPFMKMDLICCRNVFIYFDQPLQDRLLKILHYALKPKGLLFLGKSEALGPTRTFFRTLDSNARIFERNERATDPSISFSSLQLQRYEIGLKADRIKIGDTTEQTQSLIKAFAPNAIVVDENLSIREVYGAAKKYLEFPEGGQNLSLEKLLRPDLRNKTITLLHRARRCGAIVTGMRFSATQGKAHELVQPRVYPIQVNHETRFVLSFETISDTPRRNPISKGSRQDMAKEVEELERELSLAREHLQTIIQEQETTHEELQALNEELHSANEELQSTNEELETSNEELQSTNEELTTLNEELSVKTGELLDLNNYLTAIQDAIQYPIIVVDKNLNLARFNRRAERDFNLRMSHRGRNVRLIPSPENLDASFEVIENACKIKKRSTTQIRTDGHDYEIKCDPFFNHKGELDGVVVSYVDNSELLRTLRKVEASERKLNSIFENIPAAVAVKDTTGIYTYVNQIFCERFGLQSDSILGKTDAQLFDATIARHLREKDLNILSSGTSQTEEESYILAGGRASFLTSRFPLPGPGTPVESICSVSFDITPAVEARYRLEMFKDTIAASHQGILIAERQPDGTYGITFASRSIESLLDVKAEDVTGLPMDQAMTVLFGATSELDYQDFIEETLSITGGSTEAKRTVQGATRTYEVRSTAHHPEEDKAPTQISIIIMDVTERREKEELLRRKQEEVMKAAKLASLGEMAAGIAHELNTPLTTVQSYVDLIRASREDDGSFDSDVTAQALDKIENTVTRISEIIVGLRSFAKVEKTMTLSEFDLLDLAHEVLKVCDFHLRNKGVSVTIVPPERSIRIRGRRTQLSQVLVNLINNAIDAIKSLQHKWIKIAFIDTDDHVTVQVIDSGEGISEKIAAMVMTPFFTTKEEGTGLGLSLSRSIVKAHGGDLRINTDLGNTCFEVILPKGDHHGGTERNT